MTLTWLKKAQIFDLFSEEYFWPQVETIKYIC